MVRKIVLGAVLLLLVLSIVLHLPFVQRFAKDQAVDYLHQKIKTKVHIDSLSFGLFQPVKVHGLYLSDQKKDTLLAGQHLVVDFSLVDLIGGFKFLVQFFAFEFCIIFQIQKARF